MKPPETKTAAPTGIGNGGKGKTGRDFEGVSYFFSDTRSIPCSDEAKAAALSEKVERELNGDRRFFRRRPGRLHRIRRGFPFEIQQARLVHGATGAFDGRPVFVAVRQIRPGLRMRSFFSTLSAVDLDMPEDRARAMFEIVADRCMVGKLDTIANQVGLN